MIEITIPVYLAYMLWILGVIFLVSEVLKLIKTWYSFKTLGFIRAKVLEIQEVCKDPKLQKACAYTVYKIGKIFGDYK